MHPYKIQTHHWHFVISGHMISHVVKSYREMDGVLMANQRAAEP